MKTDVCSLSLSTKLRTVHTHLTLPGSSKGLTPGSHLISLSPYGKAVAPTELSVSAPFLQMGTQGADGH